MTKNIFRDSLNALYESSPLLKDDDFLDKDKWVKVLKDKKFQERRRREFFYTNLNLLASQVTLFDVMSADTFDIVLNAKKITKILNYSEVTNEILLLAFLLGDKKKQITRILQKEKKFDKQIVYEQFLENNNIIDSPRSTNLFTKLKNFYKKIFFFQKNSLIDTEFNFSKETLNLFWITAKDTYSRFQTFVITPEILFIKLMEEESSAAELIVNALKDQFSWYKLRHSLNKKIYLEENYIKSNVSSKHFYYIYLLKSKVSQDYYNHFIPNKQRGILYSGFRALLFSKVMNWDRQKFLKTQTIKSMRINSLLTYSPRSKKIKEIFLKKRKTIQEKF